MGETPSPFLDDAEDEDEAAILSQPHVFEVRSANDTLWEVMADSSERAEKFVLKKRFAKTPKEWGIRRIIENGHVVKEVPWITALRVAAAGRARPADDPHVLLEALNEDARFTWNRDAVLWLAEAAKVKEAREHEENRLADLECQTPRRPHVRPLPAWLYAVDTPRAPEPVRCKTCPALVPRWMERCTECLDRDRVAAENVAVGSVRTNDPD